MSPICGCGAKAHYMVYVTDRLWEEYLSGPGSRPDVVPACRQCADEWHLQGGGPLEIVRIARGQGMRTYQVSVGNTHIGMLWAVPSYPMEWRYALETQMIDKSAGYVTRRDAVTALISEWSSARSSI